MQPTDQYESSPIKLWSPLQRHLAACIQTKGSPQQWIGTIRNLQKGGVSEVEVKWSKVLLGLSGFPKAHLHRDDLLEYLSEKPPCELVLQRHITDEYVPQVRFEKQSQPAEIVANALRRGRREARLLHYRDRTFGLCIWLHGETDLGLFGRYVYWSLSVPHGRKKLASHDVKREFLTVQEAMAYGRLLIERMARRLRAEGFVGQTRSLNRFARFVLPGGEKYTEWLITAPNLPTEYWGEHFKLANIVAHVRTTERATAKGLRLLVLEEIQSDWNQELRKAIQEARDRQQAVATGENFDLQWDDDINPPPENPYLNHWLDAALRMMLVYAASEGFAGICWLPGQLHAERFSWANADGLRTFYDRIVPSAVEKLAKSWGAKLGTVDITTLSRQYKVTRLSVEGDWVVVKIGSREKIGESFADFDKAEIFRQSKDSLAVEKLPALFISDAMRQDLIEHGLPYLGAVGKRHTVSQPEGKDS